MERLFLSGPDSPVKQLIWEALRQAEQPDAAADRSVACAQPGDDGSRYGEVPAQGRRFACAQPGDVMTSEDSVLIFGTYTCGTPHDAHFGGAENVCDSGAQPGDLQWTEALMGAIEEVQRIRPRRSLFVSDIMVYGKLFGGQRLLVENEIGYVCHTAADGMAAQWMRTAEHFCARLAREEGLPVKIVRADWGQILIEGREPRRFDRLMESMLGILEKGSDGEAYNLSVMTPEELAEKNAECAHARRALMPVVVLPDTGKAGNYAAS